MASHSDPYSPSVTLKEQIIYFLLVGCLSMLYAELFSGASRLWVFDPWSLLMTFPLYLVHVVFFFNLALRTKKTSPVHLYLWGILFAMYESWITQVLWLGYNAQGPMVGTILGIGIGEFVALVFFWHPVSSFMLPLLVFEMLTLSASSNTIEQRILPSHVPFLVKTKSNLKYIWILYVSGSLTMAVNYQGNVFLAVAALGVTYGLIYLLYRKARQYHTFSVYSLRVSKCGMTLMIIYLLILYSVMFLGYGYYGGRISGLLPVVTTIVLYSVFGWIILSSTPTEESVNIPASLIENRFKISDYRILAAFNIVLASGLCLLLHVLPELLMGAFLFFYLAFCIVGVYLFYKALRLRNKQTSPYLKIKFIEMN